MAYVRGAHSVARSLSHECPLLLKSSVNFFEGASHIALATRPPKVANSRELAMLTRIGTRRRNAFAVLALISLATIGACHKSATEPDDPQTYDLQARELSARSP